MEGIVQGPALAVQAGNLIPELPVGVQKLVEVNVAQAGVGGRGGGGIVEDLLVEILQAGKVGSAAQGDSVAEHGLRAREPGGREVHAGDRNLGRLVEQGCADELGLCTEHAGRAGLQDFLVLALAESKLPGHPLNGAFGLEPLVHYGEEAQARHAVLVEQLARIVAGKGVAHALHGCVAEAGRGMLGPGVECRLRGRGGLRRPLCVRGCGTVHGDGLVAAFQQAAQAAGGGVQCGLWRVQAVPDLLGYDFEKAVQSVEGGQAVAEVGYRAVAQRAEGIEEFRRKGDLAGKLQEGFGGVQLRRLGHARGSWR